MAKLLMFKGLGKEMNAEITEIFYKIVGFIAILFVLAVGAISTYNTMIGKPRAENARDRWSKIISGDRQRAMQNQAENIAVDLLRK